MSYVRGEKYLGYSFYVMKGKCQLTVHPKSKAKMKSRLKELTSRSNVAKTEHSHPLGMVVSTHFRCGKGVKRGLKNGALPFKID